jgi:hypothetical protein
VTAFLSFDGMTFPNPDDPLGAASALRYGEPSQEQRLYAASVISAYRQLVNDAAVPRNEKVGGIRRARNALMVGQVAQLEQVSHNGVDDREGVAEVVVRVCAEQDGDGR